MEVKKIKVGDWVYYIGESLELTQAVGYVVSMHDEGRRATVRFIRYDDGRKCRYKIVVPIKNLVKGKEVFLLDEDYDILLDMALATNDVEWCKELARKKSECI